VPDFSQRTVEVAVRLNSSHVFLFSDLVFLPKPAASAPPFLVSRSLPSLFSLFFLRVRFITAFHHSLPLYPPFLRSNGYRSSDLTSSYYRFFLTYLLVAGEISLAVVITVAG